MENIGIPVELKKLERILTSPSSFSNVDSIGVVIEADQKLPASRKPLILQDLTTREPLGSYRRDVGEPNMAVAKWAASKYRPLTNVDLRRLLREAQQKE